MGSGQGMGCCMIAGNDDSRWMSEDDFGLSCWNLNKRYHIIMPIVPKNFYKNKIMIDQECNAMRCDAVALLCSAMR